MVKYECLMCLEEHDSEKVETIFCRNGFVSSCKKEGKKWPRCLICKEFIDEDGRNIDAEFEDFVIELNRCCGCYRISAVIAVLLGIGIIIATIFWSTEVWHVFVGIFFCICFTVSGITHVVLPCTYNFKAQVLKGELPRHHRMWRKFLLSRKKPSFKNVPV